VSENVVVIDYGSGNLRSAAKALERAGRESGCAARITVSGAADAVRRADRIVLPGVGAFADCMAGLAAIEGMVEAIGETAIEKAHPFLGICVGMQLMAESGLEHGRHAGFGWIAGEVVPLAPADPALKIPHMGWNALSPTEAGRGHPLLAGIADGDHVYFVHSYHFDPGDPACRLAVADYGGPVTAAVARRNLAGVQFHPEKSQRVGGVLLRNFLEWRP